MTLEQLITGVPQLDAGLIRLAAAELDAKTKPRGSLGRLESVCARLATVRGSVCPERLVPAIVVVAGDHGVAYESVSAYSQEVTGQMLANFASGGAAVSVLARVAGARLVVVDAGVVSPPAAPAIVDLSLGRGTANAAVGPAMSREQAVEGICRGGELGRSLTAEGVTAVVLGEMGIGNTTSAAAIVSALLGRSPVDVSGRGTGLDDAGLAHKRRVVARMLAANEPDPSDPIDVLARVGGFEIATLVGVALGSATGRAVVVLDGVISSVAGLLAVRLAPALGGYLVASHRSPEPAHGLILDELGLEPLLDLGLRLGEGTGGALALPLLEAARAILVEMATFAEAGVADSGL